MFRVTKRLTVAAALAGFFVCPLQAEPIKITDDEQEAQVEPTAFQPAENQPPVLPPTEVIGNLTPADEIVDGPGNSLFPSIADQYFGGGSPLDAGGLNSVIKGDKSLFDQSNFGSIVDLEAIREKHAGDMFRGAAI